MHDLILPVQRAHQALMTIHKDSTGKHYSLNSNLPVNVYVVLSFLYLNRIWTKWFNYVRNKFLTIATIAVIGMTTASCQLLIDNRKTGKT